VKYEEKYGVAYQSIFPLAFGRMIILSDPDFLECILAKNSMPRSPLYLFSPYALCFANGWFMYHFSSVLDDLLL